MIKGIEHTGIAAKDTHALAAWYIRMFDAKTLMTTESGNYFLGFADGSMIEIYAADAFDTPKGNLHQGMRHLAFTVVDLKAERDRFLADGVEAFIVSGNAFFFYDPEGNVLHFVEREKPLGA